MSQGDICSHFLPLTICLQNTCLKKKKASVRLYSSLRILIKTADISTSFSLWMVKTFAIFQMHSVLTVVLGQKHVIDIDIEIY